MRRIQEAELAGKKVLLRADFNVAIKDGTAQETFKIKTCRESLEFLIEQGSRVAVTSHFGRPEGQVNPEFSLQQLQADIEKSLGVKTIFVPDCIGEDVAEVMESLAEGEVAVLENVRFYPGEEKNDPEFAKNLAANFDVFINDAFSVCHRDQASVTGIAGAIPSYAGFWLQKEVENLEAAMKDPKRPAVAIIGGAKIETKLPLIKKFEESFDNILVGGKIANEAADQDMSFSEKVILPSDLAKDRLDIGPETIEKFKSIIASAETIIWNGPMGKFEETPYDLGTKAVMKAIIKSGAFSVVGGGESVQILEENAAIEKISFVSTGGGAMLEYLSGNPMPGIKALE